MQPLFIDVQFSNYDGSIEYINHDHITASYHLFENYSEIKIQSDQVCFQNVKSICYADNDDYEACSEEPVFKIVQSKSNSLIKLKLPYPFPQLSYVEIEVEHNVCGCKYWEK